MPRYIGWLINFGWNFGVAIGLLSIISTGADSDLTLGWIASLLMITLNWLVLPIWTGRNIGEFVSRTKYINSSGNKPIFIHAILNNSIGFLSLIGLILIMANFQNISTTGLPWFITGVVFILFWIVNFFFKKNSDFSQGTIDLLFSAYLVKHVATGEETGWLARFESLGDFGDKWQESSQKRQEKAAAKAKARASAKSDSEEKTKAKAKAVAKAKPRNQNHLMKNLRTKHESPCGDLGWSKDSISTYCYIGNFFPNSIWIHCYIVYNITTSSSVVIASNFYRSREKKPTI